MPETPHKSYLPIISAQQREARALWISRFDWGSPPSQRSRLEYLINRAADAGFNIILFQVRATGDAFYKSELEPWSYRLTSASSATLGADPGWDPLAVAIATAHGRGLQLHAYVNLYSVWECGRGIPPHTTPEHPYWTLANYQAEPPIYDTSWRVYSNTISGPTPMSESTSGPVPCNEYLWSSPGVDRVNEHNLAVIQDIVARYPVDGVHFDRARYPGRQYSVDPETLAEVGAATPPVSLADWQRNHLSDWMARYYHRRQTHQPGRDHERGCLVHLQKNRGDDLSHLARLLRLLPGLASLAGGGRAGCPGADDLRHDLRQRYHQVAGVSRRPCRGSGESPGVAGDRRGHHAV